MTSLAIIIPWRDNGDPDRRAATIYTHRHYTRLADKQDWHVIVSDDGHNQGEPFNRHAAYNRGLHQTDAPVILWNEADTLIPTDQINLAADAALNQPGLVIPYTERHELTAQQTATVYTGDADPFTLTGGYAVYRDGTSIGQAGVTSRHTINLIGGWDEHFAGWGYDDNAMHHIYATLAAPTRHVAGKGTHLWHTPAYHTNPDNPATMRNAARSAHIHTLTNPDQLRTYLQHPTPHHA